MERTKGNTEHRDYAVTPNVILSNIQEQLNVKKEVINRMTKTL